MRRLKRLIVAVVAVGAIGGNLSCHGKRAVQITGAGDYIVPASPKNTVKFRIPSFFRPDSGELQVFRDGDKASPLRTIKLYGKQLRAGRRSLEWDGLDDDGNHLSQADAPFTFRLVLRKDGREFMAELPDRNLTEKIFEFTFTDPPVVSGGGSSGIDIRTINPRLLLFRLKVTGAAEKAVTTFLADHDGESPGDVIVYEFITGSTTPQDVFRFYVSPTNGIPGGRDTIFYTLNLTVLPGGAQDTAGNVFDDDPDTDQVENKVVLKFHITPGLEVVYHSKGL